MAQFKHISSSLRLTISLGEEEGKTITDNPMTSAGFIFTVTASDEQIPRIWTMTGLFRLSGLVRFLIFIFRFFNC